MTMPLDEKGQWFDLAGDERLGECATEGCGGQPTKRLEADGVGSNYCSGCAAKIVAFSTAPSPDELAVVAYAEVLAGRVTAVRIDKSRHCIHGMVLADQAHSIIAALRAERDEMTSAANSYAHQAAKAELAKRAAEAEVKRLTEEKEALRGTVREMHRRAQIAEGAVQSAQYQAKTWRETIASRKGDPMFYLALNVLDDIDRSIARQALSGSKEK